MSHGYALGPTIVLAMGVTPMAGVPDPRTMVMVNAGGLYQKKIAGSHGVSTLCSGTRLESATERLEDSAAVRLMESFLQWQAETLL
mmetsp:Transcript_15941/g.32955  ORF Transcript_15941/g.32955 Transcript_15941/m.32955 type:complete len:86 (-) Transcript_15941:41-298(-)